MKKYLQNTGFFLAVLCGISSEISFSQVDTLSKHDSCLNNIVETKILRKGIYRNFKEFTTNSPSHIFNLSAYKFEKTAEYFVTIKGKNLEMKDKSGNLVELTGPIWGFCDGSKIYFKDKNLVYNEIQMLGRYCIYNKYWSAAAYDNAWNSTSPPPDYVLDLMTTREERLTDKYLINFILADDPELLNQYKEEPLKKIMLFQYVKKYNDRHPVNFQ
jgi:hypothetical protein